MQPSADANLYFVAEGLLRQMLVKRRQCSTTAGDSEMTIVVGWSWPSIAGEVKCS